MVSPCKGCPLESDEYLELMDIDPLFIQAQDYLIEKELGLQPARDQIDPLLQEAIKFVNNEQYRQREEMRKIREDFK